MRHLIHTILYMLLISVACTSCKKEAKLTASPGVLGYTLPQGNNSYDSAIMNYYTKYGTYLLYKFTGKDTYWTPTGWKNADTVAITAGYLVTQANEAYVKKQLALINKLWFSYYTDKFLKDFLPAKIMLCATIDSGYVTYVFTPAYAPIFKSKPVAAWYNYDNICVSNAGPVIDAMTARDSITYMAKVSLIFIQSMAARNMANPTAEFSSTTNYNTAVTSQALAYASGILYTYYNGPTAARDWSLYMQALVSCSETRLNKSTAATDATFNGILNATKDVNGVLRKRYNMVRNYYISNYGVDLQAIGNVADQ